MIAIVVEDPYFAIGSTILSCARAFIQKTRTESTTLWSRYYCSYCHSNRSRIHRTVVCSRRQTEDNCGCGLDDPNFAIGSNIRRCARGVPRTTRTGDKDLLRDCRLISTYCSHHAVTELRPPKHRVSSLLPTKEYIHIVHQHSVDTLSFRTGLSPALGFYSKLGCDEWWIPDATLRATKLCCDCHLTNGINP